ncbi:MAG TPA: hypothetical protein VK731_00570 [Candidatus Cybelea sp.]|jgi:hypothetical protein|nr:hypothetical protein [Candidatus Cybelea sp.]
MRTRKFYKVLAEYSRILNNYLLTSSSKMKCKFGSQAFQLEWVPNGESARTNSSNPATNSNSKLLSQWGLRKRGREQASKWARESGLRQMPANLLPLSARNSVTPHIRSSLR